MARLIKRYGSRKLYDTRGSRYVGLDEIAVWIRAGHDVRVVDKKTGEDVTAQTLVQIISEEGRRRKSFLPQELLHELIRRGEGLVASGVGQIQSGVDRLLQASVDRLAPVRRMKEETARLRERLEQLEVSLGELEGAGSDSDAEREGGGGPASRNSKGAHDDDDREDRD